MLPRACLTGLLWLQPPGPRLRVTRELGCGLWSHHCERTCGWAGASARLPGVPLLILCSLSGRPWRQGLLLHSRPFREPDTTLPSVPELLTHRLVLLWDGGSEQPCGSPPSSSSSSSPSLSIISPQTPWNQTISTRTRRSTVPLALTDVRFISRNHVGSCTADHGWGEQSRVLHTGRSWEWA